MFKAFLFLGVSGLATAAVVLETIQPRHSGLVSLTQLQKQSSVNKYITTNNRPPFPDSYYLAVNKEPIIDRPSISADQKTDVCVIGGGLAGLTTALGLAERGKKVILVESKRIGWNASGRNGGFALPGINVEPEDLIDQLGAKGAKEYYAKTMDGLRLLRARIDHYQIQCDVQDAGSLVLSTFPHSAADTLEAVEEINKALGTSFEFWTSERCSTLYHGHNYHHGVFNPDAFIIQPLGLSHGLARAAESHGVIIYEDSPARKIEQTTQGSSSESRFIVTAGPTDSETHRVMCDNVVLAGNCHLDTQLDWMVARSTVPIFTYIGVTEPLGQRLHQAIDPSAPFSVCDDITCLNYFRPLPDGRLLWGGMAQVNEVPPEKLEAIIRSLIQENFPQIGTDYQIDYLWGGDIGCSMSDYPLIGLRKPGLYYTTGFGGHGVVPTTMAGEMVAQAIASGDDSELIAYQKKFPLSFVGWPFDRVGAQLIYWYFQLCDFTNANFSRLQSYFSPSK